MIKKVLIFLIIILIISFLTFKFINKKEKNYIKTYGNVEIRQVDLSFQIDGVINNVYVEEGDYVKQGQLIASLDDKDFVANYNKAYFEEKMNSAKMNDDVSKFKRNFPLCKDDIISKEECETLLNNKNSSIAKLKASKSNKIYMKNQLDYTKLYAPQDGIISTRVQEKGARVQKGQIVYVMNLFHPLWIRTYVNEIDLGNIKYGMKAEVLTDTYDINTGQKKKYMGRIGYISPVAEFSPKTVQSEDLRVDLMYRIRIYVDEFDEFLRQGMPVSVYIKLDKNDK